MSSSSKNKISLNYFKKEQVLTATDFVFSNEGIGDYYGEVSNSVVTFGSLSKKKCVSKRIVDCRNLIKETLRQELFSVLKWDK